MFSHALECHGKLPTLLLLGSFIFNEAGLVLKKARYYYGWDMFFVIRLIVEVGHQVIYAAAAVAAAVTSAANDAADYVIRCSPARPLQTVIKHNLSRPSWQESLLTCV